MESQKRSWRQQACRRNLLQIGLFLNTYSTDHKGRLPLERGAAGLARLIESVPEARKIFYCPCDKKRALPETAKPISEDVVSYVYTPLPGPFPSDGPARPICWDKVGNHSEGMRVLYTDGHIEFLTFGQWEAIQKQK